MASSVLALVTFVGVGLSNGVSGAATVSPTPSAGTVPLVWPGDGRMLSAPLVVGGSVLGEGSLEMVGDTITSNTASFDQAPAELSLRLFTMDPDPAGGFTATLRFRVPVFVLHSWRGHAVRQTMTVVLTPPSGAAQAVQLQPDGTALTGTFASGRFSPSAPGQAVIAGDFVEFDIPASFGAAADWTVQAIVMVQANERLHQNRAATGYAAGTSVVPIGMLTSAAGGPARWGVADAVTALTSAATGPAGTQGLRPTAVRVEGTGKDQIAVVTLDGSPLQVAPSDNPHVDLDVAPAGFATLDHPLRITWLPNGTQPVTSARAAIDTIAVADVPVTVSGNEVRFGLGAFVPRSAVAARPTPRLDMMQYHTTVPIGQDEAVRAVDGISGASSSSDTADLVVNGPKVTITLASSHVPARGRIDSDGHFTAFNATDCFSGSIDAVGNVVMYLTSTNDLPALSARSRSSHQGTLLVGKRLWPLLAKSRRGTELKHNPIDPTPRPTQDPSYDTPLNGRPKLDPFGWGDLLHWDDPLYWDAPSFSSPNGAPDQPGGAQGGNPDWPNTQTVASTAPGASDAAFAMRVSGGTVPGGRPVDVTTPWVLPAMLAGSPSAPQPAGAAAANSSTGGSTALPIAIAVAAVAIIAGAAVLLVRRRRTPRAE